MLRGAGEQIERALDARSQTSGIVRKRARTRGWSIVLSVVWRGVAGDRGVVEGVMVGWVGG
jgi:hypothetical protein